MWKRKGVRKDLGQYRWILCGAVNVDEAKAHSSEKKGCKIEQREQLKRMTASEMLCCKMGVGHPWKFNLQEGGS